MQVYILMGQSNMLGEGKVIGNTTNGTLEFAVNTEKKYSYLLNKTAGGWAVLPTTRNVAIMGSGNASFEHSTIHHNEFMTVNTTLKDTIGPELGIGFALYNDSQAPTMILKSCIGDRALGWDLLPPGSKQVGLLMKVVVVVAVLECWVIIGKEALRLLRTDTPEAVFSVRCLAASSFASFLTIRRLKPLLRK